MKGVDDKQVHETLERVRKERAAGEAEAAAKNVQQQSQVASSFGTRTETEGNDSRTANG